MQNSENSGKKTKTGRPSTLYKCPIGNCKREFRQLSWLEQHVCFTKNSIIPLECGIDDCWMEFSSRKELLKHIVSAHKSALIKCRDQSDSTIIKQKNEVKLNRSSNATNGSPTTNKSKYISLPDNVLHKCRIQVQNKLHQLWKVNENRRIVKRSLNFTPNLPTEPADSCEVQSNLLSENTVSKVEGSSEFVTELNKKSETTDLPAAVKKLTTAEKEHEADQSLVLKSNSKVSTKVKRLKPVHKKSKQTTGDHTSRQKKKNGKHSLDVQPFYHYNVKIRPCFVSLLDIANQKQQMMKVSNSELHTDKRSQACETDLIPEHFFKEMPSQTKEQFNKAVDPLAAKSSIPNHEKSQVIKYKSKSMGSLSLVKQRTEGNGISSGMTSNFMTQKKSSSLLPSSSMLCFTEPESKDISSVPPSHDSGESDCTATDDKIAGDFDSNPKLTIKQKPVNHQGSDSPSYKPDPHLELKSCYVVLRRLGKISGETVKSMLNSYPNETVSTFDDKYLSGTLAQVKQENEGIVNDIALGRNVRQCIPIGVSTPPLHRKSAEVLIDKELVCIKGESVSPESPSASENVPSNKENSIFSDHFEEVEEYLFVDSRCFLVQDQSMQNIIKQEKDIHDTSTEVSPKNPSQVYVSAGVYEMADLCPQVKSTELLIDKELVCVVHVKNEPQEIKEEPMPIESLSSTDCESGNSTDTIVAFGELSNHSQESGSSSQADQVQNMLNSVKQESAENFHNVSAQVNTRYSTPVNIIADVNEVANLSAVHSAKTLNERFNNMNHCVVPCETEPCQVTEQHTAFEAFSSSKYELSGSKDSNFAVDSTGINFQEPEMQYDVASSVNSRQGQSVLRFIKQENEHCDILTKKNQEVVRSSISSTCKTGSGKNNNFALDSSDNNFKEPKMSLVGECSSILAQEQSMLNSIKQENEPCDIPAKRNQKVTKSSKHKTNNGKNNNFSLDSFDYCFQEAEMSCVVESAGNLGQEQSMLNFQKWENELQDILTNKNPKTVKSSRSSTHKTSGSKSNDFTLDSPYNHFKEPQMSRVTRSCDSRHEHSMLNSVKQESKENRSCDISVKRKHSNPCLPQEPEMFTDSVMPCKNEPHESIEEPESPSLLECQQGCSNNSISLPNSSADYSKKSPATKHSRISKQEKVRQNQSFSVDSSGNLFSLGLPSPGKPIYSEIFTELPRSDLIGNKTSSRKRQKSVTKNSSKKLHLENQDRLHRFVNDSTASDQVTAQEVGRNNICSRSKTFVTESPVSDKITQRTKRNNICSGSKTVSFAQALTSDMVAEGIKRNSISSNSKTSIIESVISEMVTEGTRRNSICSGSKTAAVETPTLMEKFIQNQDTSTKKKRGRKKSRKVVNNCRTAVNGTVDVKSEGRYSQQESREIFFDKELVSVGPCKAEPQGDEELVVTESSRPTKYETRCSNNRFAPESSAKRSCRVKKPQIVEPSTISKQKKRRKSSAVFSVDGSGNLFCEIVTARASVPCQIKRDPEGDCVSHVAKGLSSRRQDDLPNTVLENAEPNECHINKNTSITASKHLPVKTEFESCLNDRAKESQIAEPPNISKPKKRRKNSAVFSIDGSGNLFIGETACASAPCQIKKDPEDDCAGHVAKEGPSAGRQDNLSSTYLQNAKPNECRIVNKNTSVIAPKHLPVKTEKVVESRQVTDESNTVKCLTPSNLRLIVNTCQALGSVTHCRTGQELGTVKGSSHQNMTEPVDSKPSLSHLIKTVRECVANENLPQNFRVKKSPLEECKDGNVAVLSSVKEKLKSYLHVCDGPSKPSAKCYVGKKSFSGEKSMSSIQNLIKQEPKDNGSLSYYSNRVTQTTHDPAVELIPLGQKEPIDPAHESHTAKDDCSEKKLPERNSKELDPVFSSWAVKLEPQDSDNISGEMSPLMDHPMHSSCNKEVMPHCNTTYKSSQVLENSSAKEHSYIMPELKGNMLSSQEEQGFHNSVIKPSVESFSNQEFVDHTCKSLNAPEPSVEKQSVHESHISIVNEFLFVTESSIPHVKTEQDCTASVTESSIPHVKKEQDGTASVTESSVPHVKKEQDGTASVTESSIPHVKKEQDCTASVSESSAKCDEGTSGAIQGERSGVMSPTMPCAVKQEVLDSVDTFQTGEFNIKHYQEGVSTNICSNEALSSACAAVQVETHSVKRTDSHSSSLIPIVSNSSSAVKSEDKDGGDATSDVVVVSENMQPKSVRESENQFVALKQETTASFSQDQKPSVMIGCQFSTLIPLSVVGSVIPNQFTPVGSLALLSYSVNQTFQQKSEGGHSILTPKVKKVCESRRVIPTTRKKVGRPRKILPAQKPTNTEEKCSQTKSSTERSGPQDTVHDNVESKTCSPDFIPAAVCTTQNSSPVILCNIQQNSAVPITLANSVTENTDPKFQTVMMPLPLYNIGSPTPTPKSNRTKLKGCNYVESGIKVECPVVNSTSTASIVPCSVQPSGAISFTSPTTSTASVVPCSVQPSGAISFTSPTTSTASIVPCSVQQSGAISVTSPTTSTASIVPCSVQQSGAISVTSPTTSTASIVPCSVQPSGAISFTSPKMGIKLEPTFGTVLLIGSPPLLNGGMYNVVTNMDAQKSNENAFIQPHDKAAAKHMENQCSKRIPYPIKPYPKDTDVPERRKQNVSDQSSYYYSIAPKPNCNGTDLGASGSKNSDSSQKHGLKPTTKPVESISNSHLKRASKSRKSQHSSCPKKKSLQWLERPGLEMVQDALTDLTQSPIEIKGKDKCNADLYCRIIPKPTTKRTGESGVRSNASLSQNAICEEKTEVCVSNIVKPKQKSDPELSVRSGNVDVVSERLKYACKSHGNLLTVGENCETREVCKHSSSRLREEDRSLASNSAKVWLEKPEGSVSGSSQKDALQVSVKTVESTNVCNSSKTVSKHQQNNIKKGSSCIKVPSLQSLKQPVLELCQKALIDLTMDPDEDEKKDIRKVSLSPCEVITKPLPGGNMNSLDRIQALNSEKVHQGSSKCKASEFSLKPPLHASVESKTSMCSGLKIASKPFKNNVNQGSKVPTLQPLKHPVLELPQKTVIDLTMDADEDKVPPGSCEAVLKPSLSRSVNCSDDFRVHSRSLSSHNSCTFRRDVISSQKADSGLSAESNDRDSVYSSSKPALKSQEISLNVGSSSKKKTNMFKFGALELCQKAVIGLSLKPSGNKVEVKFRTPSNRCSTASKCRASHSVSSTPKKFRKREVKVVKLAFQ